MTLDDVMQQIPFALSIVRESLNGFSAPLQKAQQSSPAARMAVCLFLYKDLQYANTRTYFIESAPPKVPVSTQQCLDFINQNTGAIKQNRKKVAAFIGR